MNLDSLITVAALCVAVYAILPRVRRLELSLRFGVFGWVILCLSLVFILYLQFYQTFRTLGLTPNLNLNRWAVTTSHASFIVLLLTSIVLYFYIGLKSLSKSSVVKFREYVFELSREKKYSELFSLIEGNINQVLRIYSSNYALSRLRACFEKNSRQYPDIQSRLDASNQLHNKPQHKLKDWTAQIWRRVCRLCASILPGYGQEQEVAAEIVHEILINRNTVKAMVEIRPYFALQIFPKKFGANNEFVDIYLRYLAEDTNSVLYHEIRNNQNLEYQRGYALPKRNRLINYFFENCEIAEKYGVYKPIGEFVITHLDELYSSSSPDPYNEPMGDFYEDSQWDSELLVGIRFFDIMVTSALYQNIKWHMWLFYFRYFVDRIIRNLDPNDRLVNPTDEWPTRYHYALYEIVSCLCNWATAVDHIPPIQENVVLTTTASVNENGNIPKSSILALGQIVKQLVESDNISDRFKKYIMDIVYRRYFLLRINPKTKPYSEALIISIQCGGHNVVGDVSYDHAQYLLDAFDEFDRVPYCVELTDELKITLQKNIENASVC